MFFCSFRNDSIRRLKSFTKDALSITKMIDERERMMYHRSRSIDSLHQRSRRTSHDYVKIHNNDDDDDADYDDDFNESDSSVTRILKRRMRKKKKQNKTQANDDDDNNQNFDNLRRRLSR
jgi:hypothetical protein